MLTFRTMAPNDIGAGLRLCRASRWNQLEADWRLFLRLDPAGSEVAEKAGAVVGTVATIRYGDPFSWLSMLLVDPVERGSGIGTALFHEALAILQHEKCVRLDATPAGQIIYRRHGFTEEYPLSRMAGNVGANLRSVNGARPMESRDLSEVMSYDAGVFGADRSALILDLFSRAPQYAWVLEDSSGVRGYMLGRPGFLYDQLGPVIASDQDAARALVSSCVHKNPDKVFGVDATHFEPDWRAWLAAQGFAEERGFVRMYRGQSPAGSQSQQFAICGPEFG
jgi:GNAT superfamily N-acetyltransferase